MSIGPTRALSIPEILCIIRPFREQIAAAVEGASWHPTEDDGSWVGPVADYLVANPTIHAMMVAAATGSTVHDAAALPSHHRAQIFAHLVRLTVAETGRRAVAVAIMDSLAPLSPWIASVRAA